MTTFTRRFGLTPLVYVAFVALAAAALGLSRLRADAGGAADDPASGIIFSHGLHVQDAGIACADCHTAVTGSTRVSDVLRPEHANCASCHEEQLSDNCQMCHRTDPMEYRVPSRPDRGLVFSHAAHIERGASCESCHAGIASQHEPVGRHVPPMATCNTCHNDVQASNACEHCHTDLAILRPVDHNRTDFVRFHKQTALRNDANCRSCHTEDTCQECHDGSSLVRVDVPGSDLQVPAGPRLFATARGQGQNTLKVHDLNFRFTHGIAAQGKTMECQTCHQSQEFCSTCHLAGGNINQGSFKPASHALPGFVTLGVGSGGGGHAVAARRDIESCASCHDAEGADPTCITCHTDTDGIRGTNPRTHVRGFMANENGVWHTDPGANCYMCHTDPNARPGGVRGLTFCGYCHQ